MDDVETVDVEAMPTERLEAEVCTLAAQIAAATAQFLTLVGELDAREAFGSWGCRSMAHWLSYRCGLSLPAARDHVRVARALRGLPLISAAFARGELSFSKVRALTRVAIPEKETELIEFAQVATAAQLDRVVRAYGAVVRNLDPDRNDVERFVRRAGNDDGTVTITARVSADAAAVVLEAVEQAAIQLPRVEGASAEARRADALEVVAQRFLQPDEHGEPTTEIVIHADSTLSVGVIDKAALALSIDAMRRLGCDATLRRVCDNDDRYDIGRKRHAVPPRLRRTVVHRDRDTCRFPGCTNRHYLHVHHIEHWVEGGPTNKSNLVLLCSVHHRLMHEGHWRAIGNANHTLAFRSPSGRIFRETAPPAPRIDPSAISRRHADVTGDRITTSHGERMDLDWTVMALCTQCPPERWLRAA